MFNTLFALPFEFWLSAILLLVGFIWSAANIRNGIGIPMAAVLATILVWYFVDVFYNDYAESYMQMFSEDVLITAWTQVVIFLLVFISLSTFFHFRINRRYLANRSQVWLKFKYGVTDPEFQHYLTVMFRIASAVWFVLIIVAIFRYQDNIFNFFFPYLGKHPGPWLLSAVGGGMNSVLALATNLHMLVAAIFGVVAALSTDKRVRRLALLFVVLSWPLYVFDRTRGYILLIVIPGVFAWALLRLRGGLLKKIAVLAVIYILINAWFGFIIAVRSGANITDALLSDQFSFSQASDKHHEGLNMFEELSWIVMLTEDGTFTPATGENYLANLVNLVPRSLWPTKPTIGIDYAIARGLGGAGFGAGVYATLSQGVVGQGVVNFGVYFGAAAAAILMSLWACWLARIDLLGNKIGYLPLLGIGLIITFNMGRDITFMNLYPFVFGFAIFWWVNNRKKGRYADG